MSKILIIEDDKAIQRFLSVALKTNGYEIISEENGISGIGTFLNQTPDLVILDMGLPDIDGSEVLLQLRQLSNVPVIIVSARDKEKEKVDALDNGADDYVTKPFNINELLARIRVCLRKVNKEVLSDVFEKGDLKIDFSKRKITKKDQEIHLTPIEFKLVKLLVENRGKVITHSFIQNKIWGYESDDEYQSLRVFMASIRRKIEDDSTNPQFILTEVGVGYRFCE